MNDHFSEPEGKGKAALSYSALIPPKAVIYMLVVAAVCIAAYFFSDMLTFFVGSVIATAVFGIVVAKGSAKIGGLFTILIFAAVLLMSGSVSTAFLYLLMFLPGGLALGLSTKKQRIFNGTLSMSFLLFCVFALIWVFFFALEYTSPVSMEGVLDLLNESLHGMFGEMYDMFSTYLPEQVAVASKEEFVITNYTLFVSRLPGMAAVAVLLVNSVSFWFYKYLFLREEKNADPMQYAFFGKFMYTKVSRAGAVIYMLCTLISFFGLSGEDSMYFYNLSLVFTYMFAFSGIALADFFLAVRHGMSKFARTVICGLLFAVCILPAGLSSLVSLLGVIDSFYHLRRFINPKEDRRYL